SAAEGRLVVYCSAQNTMCEQETMAFEKKYGIKTSFIRGGTGTILAKIDAEKDNPQGDVWYGGTLDPHSQAGEMGLLEAYKSPNLAQIPEQFRDPAKIKGNYSSAIYLGVLGFGINPERLKKLNLPTPKCWKDLTDPRLKGEVQIADPQSAGTAYTALATFVQLWGEEKAFDFLKALHPNVSQYTKSGVTPSRNAARGETAVGIGFLHDYALEKRQGAPLELVVPCEGTGYELGGVSILKGARNIDNAKLFVDWALSKEGQELAWKQGDSLQILTNTTAEQSPTAFDPNKLNLINYDFEKYGATEQRKALIEKWVQDVKLAK
ncbi:MAG: ABC transporter substrate-binding protein, partial [Haemophilus sp.]|nr:ABC transporter substrate-binding protein [Haemophilus sp.]